MLVRGVFVLMWYGPRRFGRARSTHRAAVEGLQFSAHNSGRVIDPALPYDRRSGFSDQPPTWDDLVYKGKVARFRLFKGW